MVFALKAPHTEGRFDITLPRLESQTWDESGTLSKEFTYGISHLH